MISLIKKQDNYIIYKFYVFSLTINTYFPIIYKVLFEYDEIEGRLNLTFNEQDDKSIDEIKINQEIINFLVEQIQQFYSTKNIKIDISDSFYDYHINIFTNINLNIYNIEYCDILINKAHNVKIDIPKDNLNCNISVLECNNLYLKNYDLILNINKNNKTLKNKINHINFEGDNCKIHLLLMKDNYNSSGYYNLNINKKEYSYDDIKNINFKDINFIHDD